MGLFGRKRSGLPQREVVQGHTYEDAGLDAAARSAADGHIDPALAALAECRGKPEVRALRVRVLAEKLLGRAEALQRTALETGNPDAWLLAGSTFIEEAWAIRGHGWASSVGQDRFRMFFATLRKAIGPLNQAAESLPKDAVPWAQTQRAALGLQAGRDETDAIWREIAARSQTLYPAYYTRLQILAKKWGGSHEEMLAFARLSADAAPQGDPLAAMVPIAHFEVLLADQNELIGNKHTIKAAMLPNTYFSKVRTEIDAAADKWMVAIPRAHPRALEAHNAFAAAYVLAVEPVRARTHLVAMRDHLHDLPWNYFIDHDKLREEYLKVYGKFVAKAQKPAALY
ncbi:hypothetical protein [Kibdelosporangium phytohabitans]|uniref:DUF4034 domain-containing protein n=1 Tax=Kibdelosporangium phytohabitans TaxID=860235 RepID=A0A0N7F312_9PSEU|nr:hypothetical protein [Kibdelosporangium phytohabitans]ALG07343.1 hypothetical protein AOZ06_10775 [Kibdelosporangium phytohabitans]MBE1471788.1 hypothetical protein [Kibdelosporangium phytohabitans]